MQNLWLNSKVLNKLNIIKTLFHYMSYSERRMEQYTLYLNLYLEEI